MSHINIPMVPLMKDITLNVTLTGVRTWKMRQDVGVWLIKLACRVMGCGFMIEVEQAEAERHDRRQSL